jgi:predicted ATPase
LHLLVHGQFVHGGGEGEGRGLVLDELANGGVVVVEAMHELKKECMCFQRIPQIT